MSSRLSRLDAHIAVIDGAEDRSDDAVRRRNTNGEGRDTILRRLGIGARQGAGTGT